MTAWSTPSLFLFLSQICTQDVRDGGAIKAHDAYLYGRFETRMQSTPGDGVVSSFFLYNWDLDCMYPDNLNEIDIEMTGNLNNSVQFTTHHPLPLSQTQIVPVPFNPLLASLIHPMRIFMNL